MARRRKVPKHKAKPKAPRPTGDPLVATRCVYAHPEVEFRKHEGAFSVRAGADLDVGTLVLVEHVFSGSQTEMHALMYLDAGLRRALHPRHERDDEADAAGDSETNGEKISMNAFAFDDDLVIGDKVSKFNHACKPNSYMSVVDRIDDVKFYGVWTVAKVGRGEELTLDYANGHADAHDVFAIKHGVVCACTPRTLEGGRARAAIELDLATSFTTQARERFIAPHVDAYLREWEAPMAEAHKEVRRFARENIRHE